MAVPKRKSSRRWKGWRRSHDALTAPGLVHCSNCQELIRPHHFCPKCGHYKGKQIVEIENY
jgi:large subunit ribosomal protein L32